MNKIEKFKDHAIFHITGNKINGDVIIDLDDIDKISIRQWHIKDGKTNNYVASKMNNKTTIKMFSIKKYGYDEAFRLACKAREKWEKENNILTAKTFNDYRNLNKSILFKE